MVLLIVFFLFQAEDGIRAYKVTGVQTCALPIASGTPEAGGWLPVHSSTGPGPALNGTWQLTPVQGPEWPKRPAGTALELVALDEDGVWVASAPPPDPAGTLSLAWQRLDDTGQGASYAAALDVGP